MADIDASVSQKTIFALSLFSNALSQTPDGTVAQLSQKLQGLLLPAVSLVELPPGSWSVVWGPLVYKFEDGPTGSADQAAYIARKGNNYVVAIAGTNRYSTRAKEVYDACVLRSVDWNAWTGASGGITSKPPIDTFAKPGSRISEGTARGIYELVNAPTAIGPGQGTTILQFLKTLPNGSTVYYTGHSLGGALSPTLALGLLNLVPNVPKANVLTLPTAGPAPGNAGFASLYASTFPRNGDFNYNLINTRDIVTFAWNVDMSANPKRCMQYLYNVFGNIPLSPKTPLVKKLDAAVGLALVAKNFNKMVYQFLPSPPDTQFTGTSKLPHDNPQDEEGYMDNALFAHVQDYLIKFKIPVPKELGDIVVDLPLPDEDQLPAELQSAFDEDGNFTGPGKEDFPTDDTA